jgi:hypothetical protein
MGLCDVSFSRGACGDQSNLGQFRSDGRTTIPIGAATDESTVKFRGFVSDPIEQQVRLEIELRRLNEYGGSFTGYSTQASLLGASGRVAEIPVYGLINGRYHWRARTFNAGGQSSPWVSFGGNSDSAKDFTVQVGACSPFAVSGDGIPKATSCGGQAQVGPQSATDVSQTNATLRADINPNGSGTTAFFEYGVSPASLIATPHQALGADFVTREVRQDITGLTCGTAFQFRAVATNDAGRSEGSFQTFRTTTCPPGGTPPETITQAANEFGPTSVTLTASINPNGSSTNAFFEHGIRTDVLTSTGSEQIGSGEVRQYFSQFVTGLTCNTQYYYRIVAVNAFGMQEGDFLTFGTAPCPQQSCFLLSFNRLPVEGGDLPIASPSYSVGCATGRYNPGEQIHITARPAPGWTVGSWTGTQDDTSRLMNNVVSMPSYDDLVWVYYNRPCGRSFTEPFGGDIWKKGESHNIRWTWGGCGQNVKVQLIKEGVLYDNIATLPAITESYIWTPALWYENGTKYQIKVVDAVDPSILALTPFFTLIDP